MDEADRLKDELLIARSALQVARQIDLAGVGETIVRVAMEYGRATAALLYLYDGEQDVFHLQASHIPPDDPRRKGILTLDLAEVRGE
ncbi:MAG TPA: hypothetical protein VNL37_02865, partial [Candidatus Polarisedimenticolia bacterium]|nr:hypothetical protein [Candidatus Polarisedimenticolia bacterium]